MDPTEQHVAFRRAWAYKNLCEHDSICWRYMITLAKPMIEFSDSSAQVMGAGPGHQESSTIRMSEALIERHAWDTTALTSFAG